MLHESGVTGDDAVGNPLPEKIHKKITPRNDCCISRENPQRKLPASTALVAGFNSKGSN